MNDMRKTIVPKSDQLNADSLIAGPITIRVTKVLLTAEADQPVSIHYENDNGQPFKACKSMRRVLVHAWGPDANVYIGRQMTLYRDPTVKWAGQDVGGIRISHMSHIDRDLVMALTASKSVRKPYIVKMLKPGNAAASTGPAQAAERAPDADDQIDDSGLSEAPRSELELWADQLDIDHGQITDAAKLHKAWSDTIKLEQWGDFKEAHPERAVTMREVRTARIAQLKVK